MPFYLAVLETFEGELMVTVAGLTWCNRALLLIPGRSRFQMDLPLGGAEGHCGIVGGAAERAMLAKMDLRTFKIRGGRHCAS